MSSQVVMSSKQANNNPGLCPIKGQQVNSSNQIMATDQFLGLSLCPKRVTPHCQML